MCYWIQLILITLFEFNGSEKKKNTATSKDYHFLAQLMRFPCTTLKTEKKKIFLEIIKPGHKLSNAFILLKSQTFWLSSECFSILCDAFLLKSVHQ